jgi:hypothetical protein
MTGEATLFHNVLSVTHEIGDDIVRFVARLD